MKQYLVKHFTHTDLDGVGCSVVSKYMYGGSNDIELQISYCNYNEINEEVNDFLDTFDMSLYVLLLITDLSVNPETAKRIDELQKSNARFACRMFDHHQLPKEITDYDWATVDNGGDQCGTSLLFENFIGENYTEQALVDFVEAVRLYDLWKFDKEKRTKAEDLNILLYMFGVQTFREMILHEVVANPHSSINLTTGWVNDVLRAQYAQRDEYIEQKEKVAQDVQYKGLNGKYVFAEQYSSMLGYAMLRDFPEAKFVAIVNPNGKVSLRSRDNEVNVGMLAKQFGGGGHPAAAGYKIKPFQFVMEVNDE